MRRARLARRGSRGSEETGLFSGIRDTGKLAVKENVAAANVALTNDDLREIGDSLAQIAVQGDRYPAHLAALVGK